LINEKRESIIDKHFREESLRVNKNSFHENAIFDEIVAKARRSGEMPFKIAI
jgi:hypothetical protein